MAPEAERAPCTVGARNICQQLREILARGAQESLPVPVASFPLPALRTRAPAVLLLVEPRRRNLGSGPVLLRGPQCDSLQESRESRRKVHQEWLDAAPICWTARQPLIRHDPLLAGRER